MGYELYQSRHKGYEIDNLLDDVKEIKPKVDAMEQGYEANKVKMADGTVLPAFLATQMASKNDINDMATNASVAQAISQATSDFITGTEVDGKIATATTDMATNASVSQAISQATGDFVTGSEVDTKISQATGDFVTGSEVDTKISQATGDFVTGSEVDTKISQATGDFVTESDVEEIISDDFTNKETLDDLSTSEEGNLLFKGQEIRGGGTDVEANPMEDASEDLEKIKIGDTVYGIPEGGTDVEANPPGFATEDLETIKIGETVYGIPEGGGSGKTVSSIDVAPVGTIISFMGKTAPKNYLICNGATYEIAKFKELSDFIKAQFGSYNFFGGDGETTFAVPDLRGEFLRGTGTNGHTGQGPGSAVGIHQAATQIPDLYGCYNGTLLNKYYSLYTRYSGDITGSGIQYNMVENADAAANGNKNAVFAGQGFAPGDYTGVSSTSKRYAFTARPTNTSVLYCIKYTIKENIDVNVIAGYEDYSEEEIVIGRWIDGRPIYRKTFETLIPEYNDEGGSNTINLSDLQIDKLLQLSGFSYSKRDNNVGMNPFPFIVIGKVGENIQGHRYWYNANTQMLTIQNTLVSTNGRDLLLIFEYTKTTDALNSFRPDMLKMIPLADEVTEEEIMTVINVLKEAE